MNKGILSFTFLVLLIAGNTALCATQEIKLATLSKPGSPQYTAGSKFKEQLETRSLGRFSVTLDPAATGTREAEVIDQIQTGAIQMGILAASAVEPFDPIVRVLSFPFLFSDEQQADTVLDGPLGAAILRDLETVGCKGLGFSEIGFRNLSNSLRPVHNIDDLKGMKIRVPSSPVQTALWLALGANPVPRPWPIYSELEQGLLDAQESPLRVIENYSFFEIQKYLTLTRHIYSASINIASLKWWDTLSQEDQELIEESMRVATVSQRLDQRARDAACLTVLRGKGMLVEEHPDIASFRNRIGKLKEMTPYREPKVQALLGKMQEAALLPPAPRPQELRSDSIQNQADTDLPPTDQQPPTVPPVRSQGHLDLPHDNEEPPMVQPDTGTPGVQNKSNAEGVPPVLDNDQPAETGQPANKASGPATEEHIPAEPEAASDTTHEQSQTDQAVAPELPARQ